MRSPLYGEPQTLPLGGAAQRRAPGGPRLSAASTVCVCPRAAAPGPAPTPPSAAPQRWGPGDHRSSLEQGLAAVCLGPFYPFPSIRNASAHEHSQKAPSPPGGGELRNGDVRSRPPLHTHTNRVCRGAPGSSAHRAGKYPPTNSKSSL